MHLNNLTHSSHLINRTMPDPSSNSTGREHVRSSSGSSTSAWSSHAASTTQCITRQSSGSTTAAGGGDSALKRQKQPISSSSGLNRLGGDVSLPSQSQSSQPILPTVVVPSPPAILTNPEAEDHDEDLELPTLEQEETTGSPSKKQNTGKKKKKPDDNDESPEHSASSSNYNPNNPANLPVQYESEEDLNHEIY